MQNLTYNIDLEKRSALDVKITNEGFSVTDGTRTFRYTTRPTYDFDMRRDPWFEIGGFLNQFNAELETPLGDIRGNYLPPIGTFGSGSMQITSAPAIIRGIEVEQRGLRSRLFETIEPLPRIFDDKRRSKNPDPIYEIRKNTEGKYKYEKFNDDSEFGNLHQSTEMPSFIRYIEPISEKGPEKDYGSKRIKPKDTVREDPIHTGFKSKLKMATLGLGIAAALLYGINGMTEDNISLSDAEDIAQKRLKDALRNLQVDDAYRMFQDAQRLVESPRIGKPKMHVTIDLTVNP